MEYFIVVVGFLGGWLLFAGPLRQAWLELREETFDHEEMEHVVEAVPKPPRVSTWWWLLPPVAWIKARNGQNEYRKAVTALLTDEQREHWVSFNNKATAWFVVAGGAYLIAVKETWEAVGEFDLWVGLFWILIVILPIISVVTLALLAAQTEKQLGHEKPAPRQRRAR
jgi:hypothetical protein